MKCHLFFLRPIGLAKDNGAITVTFSTRFRVNHRPLWILDIPRAYRKVAEPMLSQAGLGLYVSSKILGPLPHLRAFPRPLVLNGGYLAFGSRSVSLPEWPVSVQTVTRTSRFGRGFGASLLHFCWFFFAVVFIIVMLLLLFLLIS